MAKHLFLSSLGHSLVGYSWLVYPINIALNSYYMHPQNVTSILSASVRALISYS